MAEEKKCFIIMPLTTPEFMLDKYRDGKDHFKHVLDCLFVPSVEKAGYQAEPPIAKGADLIHAEIVRNLETAEIVLCDMSCLNPNVFFEFGIRTSLNKPVCVVTDELTEEIPFDTAILNYHEYKSSLEPWQLAVEIKALCDHIVASGERSNNENTLWKYFGLKTPAAPYEGEGGTEAKLDYVSMKLDSLINQLMRGQKQPKPEPLELGQAAFTRLRSIAQRLLPEGNKVTDVWVTPDGYLIEYAGPKLRRDQSQDIEDTLRDAYRTNATLQKL